jgi:AcrR family transcriptional regulator
VVSASRGGERPASQADPAAVGAGRTPQWWRTRRRILAAAVVVFDRDGYVTARVEDVAATAGTTRANFYLHFRSKLEVVLEVSRPLVVEFRALHERLDALDDPTWEQLHPWMVDIIDFWSRNLKVIGVFNQALAVEPDMADQYMAWIHESVHTLAAHLERWGGFDPEDARLRASMVTLQIERFCYIWLVRRQPFGRDESIAALTDALWTALHPPRRRKPAQ